MSEIVIAAFMWGVVSCVAISQARDSDRSVLISSLAVAVSLSFNIDAIYLAGDQLLGGRNWLELVSDLALMAGISFLLRGLLRATVGRRRAYEWLQTVGLFIGCVVLAVLFARIVAPTSSTTFMLSYGRQTTAAAYSISQFLFVGAAMLIMAVVSIRHLSELTHTMSRASFLLVSVGCVLAVLLSAVIIGMDLAHVAGNIRLMNALSILYQPFYTGAIALLCVGYSVPPVVRRAQTLRYRRETSLLLNEVSRVWRDTVDMQVAIPVNGYRQLGGLDNVSGDVVLHRMVVEIRDAAIKNQAALPAAADRFVRAAETHLLTPHPTPAAAQSTQ